MEELEKLLADKMTKRSELNMEIQAIVTTIDLMKKTNEVKSN